MIGNIILALPAITCVLCYLMIKLKNDDRSTKQFSLVMLMAFVFFVDMAIRKSDSSSPELVEQMRVLMQWVTLAMEAAIFIYIHGLLIPNVYRTWMVVFYMPAIVQGTLSTFLYFASMNDAVLTPFYIYVSTLQFHFIAYIILIALFICTVVIGKKLDISYRNVVLFFFKGKESTTEKVILILCQGVLLLMLPSAISLVAPPLVQHIVTYTQCILLSINIFYLGYVNFVHQQGTACTYESLTHMSINGGLIEVSPVVCPAAQGFQTDAKEEVEKEIAATTAEIKQKEYSSNAGENTGIGPIPVKDLDTNAINSNDTRLFEALTSLMQEEMLFTDQNISLDSLVTRLNTNRTYLSRVINKFYQISFRDYINLCRIEYSMTYMREHPQDTQELVAARVGFPNAQSFSRKFKEIVGKTPKQWVIECRM